MPKGDTYDNVTTPADDHEFILFKPGDTVNIQHGALRRAVQKVNPAFPVYRKLARVARGSTAQLNWLFLGDSMGMRCVNWLEPIFEGFWPHDVPFKWGAGGTGAVFYDDRGDSTFSRQCLQATGITGDVVTNTYNAELPGGPNYDIGVNGVVAFQSLSSLAPEWDKAIIFYLKQPGGGTFQIELDDGSGNYSIHTASVDTDNPTTALGILEISQTIAKKRIRITALTGTCRVYFPACRIETTSGINFYAASPGSWNPNLAANYDSSLLRAFLEALEVDFITVQTDDTKASYEVFMPKFEAAADALAYDPSVLILAGGPKTSSDSAMQEAAEFIEGRCHAKKYMFFDTGKEFNYSYSQINALGEGGDGTHLTDNFWIYCANKIALQMGLFDTLLSSLQMPLRYYDENRPTIQGRWLDIGRSQGEDPTIQIRQEGAFPQTGTIRFNREIQFKKLDGTIIAQLSNNHLVTRTWFPNGFAIGGSSNPRVCYATTQGGLESSAPDGSLGVTPSALYQRISGAWVAVSAASGPTPADVFNAEKFLSTRQVDGFVESTAITGSGTAGWESNGFSVGFYARTGTTAASTARVESAQRLFGGGNRGFFNRQTLLKMRLGLPKYTANGISYARYGSNGKPSYGFKIVGRELYGFVHDGTSETLTPLIKTLATSNNGPVFDIYNTTIENKGTGELVFTVYHYSDDSLVEETLSGITFGLSDTYDDNFQLSSENNADAASQDICANGVTGVILMG